MVQDQADLKAVDCTVFQAMTERQAHRLSELGTPTPAQLVSLDADDLPVSF